MKEKYWFEQPIDLFVSFNIIPNSDMTKEERINSITRLILILTIVVFIITRDITRTLIFLILAMIMIWVIANVERRKNELLIVEMLPCNYNPLNVHTLNIQSEEKDIHISRYNPNVKYNPYKPEGSTIYTSNYRR
ncbi:hypothetical protein D3C87_806320 [compost metagenome]